MILFWSGVEAFAARTEEDSISESKRIGRWLARAVGHRDISSATPVGPLRSGRKFFVKTQPLQMASDYGVSVSEVPFPSHVKRAYEGFGVPTSTMGSTWRLTRFHVIWSFDNLHDISYSWLYSDELRAWGAAYKYVFDFDEGGPFYFAYRLGYSSVEKTNWFSGQEITNELLASWYLILADFYAGVRHTIGQGKFDSTVAALSLPKYQYISDFHEIQYLVGATIATSTNTRATLQIAYANGETVYSGKLSFRFEELYPTFENWFRDPRRLYK